MDPANGIREFIVGTGGADHTSITTIAANSEVRNTTTFGVLKLTLHPASYDWQFVPEAGKTFTDSGTQACHGPIPNTPTPTLTATTIGANTATPTLIPTIGSMTSLTFNPVADTYVNAASTGSNYGSATTFRADGSPDVHAYLRFVVSGTGGAAINQARLLIFSLNSDSSGIQALGVANNTWGELTTNYTNAPPLGSLLASSGAFAANAWVTLNVTSYITGDGTFSFGVTNLSSTAIGMDSREIGRQRASIGGDF